MVSLAALLITTAAFSTAAQAASLASFGHGALRRRIHVPAARIPAQPEMPTNKKRTASKQRRCAAKASSSSLALTSTTTSSTVVVTPNDQTAAVNVPVVAQPDPVTTPTPTPTPQPAPVQQAAKETPTPSPVAVADNGSSVDASGGLSAEQAQSLLTLHNNLRAQHDAAPLTWSDDLANIAEGWANKCVFQHSGGSLGPYGENLAAGTGSSYDVTNGFNDWAAEEPSYHPSNPDPSHYTQIVWKGSQQVGCGMVPYCAGILGGAKFLVCEYSPAGNVIGDFAQNVQ